MCQLLRSWYQKYHCISPHTQSYIHTHQSCQLLSLLFVCDYMRHTCVGRGWLAWHAHTAVCLAIQTLVLCFKAFEVVMCCWSHSSPARPTNPYSHLLVLNVGSLSYTHLLVINVGLLSCFSELYSVVVVCSFVM